MSEAYFNILEKFFEKLILISPKAYMFLGAFSDIFSIKLLEVDEKPITIGKVLIGLFFFTLGIFFSRLLVQVLAKRILNPFIENRSASHAIENITLYVLIAFFSILALQVANIPITVFGYIGAAIGLAFGLGAQNIANNFLSGIILMIERPVKIGDFVFVDDVYGRIEDIGMRATKINSIGNKHLIVPNSKMLEKRVDNWTHNSRRIKEEIKVGVVYGSDVELTQKLLVEAAKEEPLVLKFSEPFVIFEDFGDNSLVFRLYYDIKIKDLFDDKHAESSIRYRINSKFKENGITIAFPQRDVHLRAPEPIQIKMG